MKPELGTVKVVLSTKELEVELSKLKTGVFNPRQHFDDDYIRSLADSMATEGQRRAIWVTPKMEVIDGECRVQAAELKGWKKIRADIKDVSEEDADALALKENLERQNLSDIEIGHHLVKMAGKYHYGDRAIEVLAKHCKQKARWVYYHIQLVTKTHPEVQHEILHGVQNVSKTKIPLPETEEARQTEEKPFVFTAAHARELARLPLEEQPFALANIKKLRLDSELTAVWVTQRLAALAKKQEAPKLPKARKMEARPVEAWGMFNVTTLEVLQKAAVQATCPKCGGSLVHIKIPVYEAMEALKHDLTRVRFQFKEADARLREEGN